MEPQEIFKELMKSEELQSHFEISQDEASSASYTCKSDSTPIEIIKDVINCVANRRTIPATFQGILKKIAE